MVHHTSAPELRQPCADSTARPGRSRDDGAYVRPRAIRQPALTARLAGPVESPSPTSSMVAATTGAGASARVTRSEPRKREPVKPRVGPGGLRLARARHAPGGPRPG